MHACKNVGDKRGVQVCEEGRGESHKQAKNEALRALLRAALPRRRGLEFAAAGLQGEGRERGSVASGLLQAPRGHRRTPGLLGHRFHLQRASPPLHLVRPHQATPALPCRAQCCSCSSRCAHCRSCSSSPILIQRSSHICLL